MFDAMRQRLDLLMQFRRPLAWLKCRCREPGRAQSSGSAAVVTVGKAGSRFLFFSKHSVRCQPMAWWACVELARLHERVTVMLSMKILKLRSVSLCNICKLLHL